MVVLSQYVPKLPGPAVWTHIRKRKRDCTDKCPCAVSQQNKHILSISCHSDELCVLHVFHHQHHHHHPSQEWLAHYRSAPSGNESAIKAGPTPGLPSAGSQFKWRFITQTVHVAVFVALYWVPCFSIEFSHSIPQALLTSYTSPS